VAGRKMHADEVDIDDDVARALIVEQFPQWADLLLERMPSTGTDNAIYRLGRDLGVRMPRIHWAVHQIEREHEWLARLAPHLPCSVPRPLARGAPGCGYPYPWLVYRWLDGDDALVAEITDWCRLAHEITTFVSALQRFDPTGGPPAPRRGGPLAPHDETTRRAIHELHHVIDVDRAMAVWDAALSADPWTGPPVWVHGDLLPGNVLVRGGRLAGIIDWSATGVGDPACEAMLAWALPADARAIYRASLDIDDATWTRARGWTLEQAAKFIPYYAETIPEGVAAARRRLDAVLDDEDP
jgi:aminoglycoside phosphotransferase (APT) family kinase protein